MRVTSEKKKKSETTRVSEEERCDGNGNKFNAQLNVISKYLLYASIEYTGYLLQYIKCGVVNEKSI